MAEANTAINKKNVERKRYPQVVNVLKKSVGATTITKQILDLRVNLIVSELLASVPMVEKQLTKAISENKVVQFQVNILGSTAAFEAPILYSCHLMGSPKAKVRLKNSFKVTTLLDTSTKIHFMTRELMKKANLAIKKGPKLELVSYMGHSRPFLGLCEDIEVAIGGLKTRDPIFIVETGDYDLVLSQPFLNLVKFC